jgi:hypothetical protein
MWVYTSPFALCPFDIGWHYYRLIISFQIVLAPRKFTHAFIAAVCAKSGFMVTEPDVSEALLEPTNPSNKLRFLRVDGDEMDGEFCIFYTCLPQFHVSIDL